MCKRAAELVGYVQQGEQNMWEEGYVWELALPGNRKWASLDQIAWRSLDCVANDIQSVGAVREDMVTIWRGNIGGRWCLLQEPTWKWE